MMGFAWALAACHKEAPAPPAAPALPAAPAPPASAAPDLCPGMCERARALKCKHDEGCVAACRQMSTASGCATEMAAVLSCLAREPLEHWECNSDGEPAIKDGYCDAEQSKFVACARVGGAKGPAPRAP